MPKVHEGGGGGDKNDQVGLLSREHNAGYLKTFSRLTARGRRVTGHPRVALLRGASALLRGCRHHVVSIKCPGFGHRERAMSVSAALDQQCGCGLPTMIQTLMSPALRSNGHTSI